MLLASSGLFIITESIILKFTILSILEQFSFFLWFRFRYIWSSYSQLSCNIQAGQWTLPYEDGSTINYRIKKSKGKLRQFPWIKSKLYLDLGRLCFSSSKQLCQSVKGSNSSNYHKKLHAKN